LKELPLEVKSVTMRDPEKQVRLTPPHPIYICIHTYIICICLYIHMCI